MKLIYGFCRCGTNRLLRVEGVLQCFSSHLVWWQKLQLELVVLRR